MTVTAADFDTAIEGLADRTVAMVPRTIVYTTTRIITRIPLAAMIEFILIGDGGGGGGGENGGGGGAGQVSRMLVPVSQIPATMTIVIGTGGAGGAADANGANGGGALLYSGSYGAVLMWAQGGRGGLSGVNGGTGGANGEGLTNYGYGGHGLGTATYGYLGGQGHFAVGGEANRRGIGIGAGGGGGRVGYGEGGLSGGGGGGWVGTPAVGSTDGTDPIGGHGASGALIVNYWRGVLV